MAKAIHLINRREGTIFQGMTRWEGEKNAFRSCCWVLSDEQANELLGGWVYFHQTKADPSGFGGLILGFDQGRDDMSARKVILFRADPNGRGQAWRGKDHGMAYTSGIVDADQWHEQ